MLFNRRRLLAVALGGLPALGLLSGCGFRPLYGNASSAGGGRVMDQLAEVRVQPLPDRTGQIMHNMLTERLNPLGQPAATRYALSMSLSESITEVGLETDETASRANLTLRASFRLVDPSSNRVLYRGLSRSTNSYDIIENQFASGVAEDDARRRGIEQVANEVMERLGVYFATGAT